MNVRAVLGTLAVCAWAAGCVGAATGPDARRFVGYYSSGFEEEAFRPCGLEEAWWVTDGVGLRARYRELGKAPYQPILVEVRGEVTPLGGYGHLASYDREIRVIELLGAPAERQGDCE